MAKAMAATVSALSSIPDDGLHDAAPEDAMSQLSIFSLDGQVALVVGGGGAIGSALAVGLAGAGAKVAVSGQIGRAHV